MDLNDERGVVLGWLIKVVVVLSILGVVLYEIGAITVNYFGLDTSADDIAIALSTRTQEETPTEAELMEQAKREARVVEAKLVRLKVNPENQTMTIVLRRKASTLILHEIPGIKDWAKATVTGKSGTQ